MLKPVAGPVGSINQNYVSGAESAVNKNKLNYQLAAGLGIAAGSTAGGVTAFNSDVNNRQIHSSEQEIIAALAAEGKCTEEEIMAVACAMVQCLLGRGPGVVELRHWPMDCKESSR